MQLEENIIYMKGIKIIVVWWKEKREEREKEQMSCNIFFMKKYYDYCLYIIYMNDIKFHVLYYFLLYII